MRGVKGWGQVGRESFRYKEREKKQTECHGREQEGDKNEKIERKCEGILWW